MDNTKQATEYGTTPNATAPKRVVIFVRSSLQHQDNGHSCGGQIDELQALAQANGWRVVEVIRDDASRTGAPNRPAIAQLRALAANGETDAVLCTSFDRLTRNVTEFQTMQQELAKQGVEFVFTTNQDVTMDSKWFMEVILTAAKSIEHEQMAEKSRAAWRRRREASRRLN